MEETSPGNKLKELIARQIFGNNFAGYVFANVRRMADPNIPSIMGVGIMPDGKLVLVYHPELIMKTSEENIKYVIEHELMHLLNKHPVRALRILASETDPFRLQFKQQILNVAADCAVNAQGNLPKKLTIGGQEWKLHFAKDHNLPEKLTTEAMYNILIEREEKNQEEKKKNGENGKGEKMIVFIPGVGVGEVDPSELGGIKSIDYHGVWTEGAGSSADIGSILRKCDSDIVRIIRTSLKQFERRRGTLPGHYAELIEKALSIPQAPYYQIISRYVRASKLSKFKRSPTMINRKRTYVFQDNNIPIISPFPGRKRDFSFKIGVLLDTSGSMMQEDILEGLSGVKHIIEKDRHTDTTILEVDTQVEKEYKCKRVRDIQLKIKGRGGTTLGPGFFRAKELNVDVCLVFTDAATEKISDYSRKDLPKKMIFVVPDNANVETIKGLGPIVRIKK
jgi:predicted metal-dependent peptidase